MDGSGKGDDLVFDNCIHGDRYTHFYKKWDGMKDRVNNDIRYILNGITLDPKWENYLDFKADMYESYLVHLDMHGKSNTTLDRKDNSGAYSKANCRWATRSEQARNRNMPYVPA